MSTVADELLGWVSRIGHSELDSISNLWRLRPLAVEARADALIGRWAAEGRSTDSEPHGDPLHIAGMLRAMDRQLATVNPDTHDRLAAQQAGLSVAEVEELTGRWDRSGTWAHDARGLLLPSRRAGRGLAVPKSPIGPLQFTAAVLGDHARRLRVVRLDDIDEPRDWSPLTAADCAVAPLVGAAELALDFYRSAGGARYRGKLAHPDVADETLDGVLASAAAQGARLLLLPEYALCPELYDRWLAALKRSNGNAPDLLVLGSGPIADAENAAVLVTVDGEELGAQPKTVPFDILPHELDDWSCPTYEAFADEQVIEDIRARAEWTLFESRVGRIAIAVCESFKPQTGDDTVVALGLARPTVLLCPVLSKPLNDSRWERWSTGAWGSLGVDTVVANSLVVGEWKNGGPGAAAVACGLWRPAGRSTTVVGAARGAGGGLDVALTPAGVS